jgi:hypothetical protein
LSFVSSFFLRSFSSVEEGAEEEAAPFASCKERGNDGRSNDV